MALIACVIVFECVQLFVYKINRRKETCNLYNLTTTSRAVTFMSVVLLPNITG